MSGLTLQGGMGEKAGEAWMGTLHIVGLGLGVCQDTGVVLGGAGAGSVHRHLDEVVPVSHHHEGKQDIWY